jgi:hypothetical protein
MKAIVKATGKIVELADSCYLNDKDFQHSYYAEELDGIENTPDYWTRLEHQYAGMAMQGLMSNVKQITPKKGRSCCDEIVDISFNVAHALVQKLKEKEERK